MKLSKLALLAAICCGSTAFAADNHTAYYESGLQAGSGIAQVGFCDCGEADCGCEAVTDCGCSDGCDGGCDGGCDSACGLDLGGLGCCDLDDPMTLFGSYKNYSAGGWLQMGYHSEGNSLFNSQPDAYQLHQAWLWAERSIDTSCGFDIGGRVDYVYGIDAPDTQAFGTAPTGWDNSWNRGGGYGHALPQAYLEAGYGDLSVKIGHFFTLIGYEVVGAPDNFFYSHAYTMYNSEPFTHTGALATYNYSDDVTAYGGYTMGWDSGFDDNGDSFLGGLTVQMTDCWSLTYGTTFGRFGEARFNGVEKGYMQSIVSTHTLSDNLEYVSQSDYLKSEDETGANVRDTYGINQYLFYTHSDCLSSGARLEWWNTQPGAAALDADVYALTLGLNYKPHGNVIVRPEVRWDWDDSRVVNLDNRNATDLTTFGIDTILLF